MRKKRFQTTNDVIEILKQGTIKGKVYQLPDVQLERPLYERVNKVLVALGAKWNRKLKGHVFDYDITQAMDNVIKTGIVIDWKKSADFYYTPQLVALEMLSLIPEPINAQFTVLEPSAGQGHIADAIKGAFANAKIHCVELNPNHCERLRQKGYKPNESNFLDIKPANKTVDYVIMNPPFSEEIEHIKHALKFVKNDGMLVSIASSTILSKNTKKNKDFRTWFERNNGYEYDLPPNSFKESGTGVSAKILAIGSR